MVKELTFQPETITERNLRIELGKELRTRLDSNSNITGGE